MPTAGETPPVPSTAAVLADIVRPDARLRESDRSLEEALNKLRMTPEKIDEDIILDKQLRKELDTILQTLKHARQRRHRALAITRLEDVIMRLGMDLKELGQMKGPQPAQPESREVARARAERAYLRYGNATDFKNVRGEPMPDFSALPNIIQLAWEAASRPDIPSSSPYPNSYDPTNTTVDPTAEGLKL